MWVVYWKCCCLVVSVSSGQTLSVSLVHQVAEEISGMLFHQKSFPDSAHVQQILLPSPQFDGWFFHQKKIHLQTAAKNMQSWCFKVYEPWHGHLLWTPSSSRSTTRLTTSNVKGTWRDGCFRPCSLGLVGNRNITKSKCLEFHEKLGIWMDLIYLFPNKIVCCVMFVSSYFLCSSKMLEKCSI